MKTIVNMPAEQMLGAVYDTAEAIEKFMKDTDLLSLRKIMPEFPEGISREEAEKLMAEQGRKNIKAMARRCLKEKPEATCEILRCLVVPDEGEELTGLMLLSALVEILSAPGLVDTFFKLVKSALENFGD